MSGRSFGASSVIALLLGSIAVAAAPDQQAQRPAAGQPPIIDRIESAMADLKLTDEQKSKIHDILSDARQQLQKAREEMSKLEPAQRAQKLGPILQQVREDLMSVLDNDQKARLEEKIQQFRQRMRDRERSFAPAANDAPATQPSRGAGSVTGEGFRPGVLVERLRDNLQKLDLSDEQKAKLDKVFEETKAKGQELMQQARQGSDEARQKLRNLAQESRKRVGEILSKEQLQKLREMMEAEGFSPPPSERSVREEKKDEPKKEQSRADEPKMTDDQKMSDDPKMTMDDKPRDKKPAAQKGDAPAVAAVAAGPAIGDPAPELKLQRLDGGNVDLATKGRVTVVVFGSLSCPSFRQRAAGLEKLKSASGNRASIYVIYAKEAHPLGGWEVNRNKDEGVSVDEPRDLDARRALANKMRDALKLSTPILIDSMDNAATTALGAGTNSAYVISRDGTIAAKQQWFEPTALKRYIDQAAVPANAPQAAPRADASSN